MEWVLDLLRSIFCLDVGRGKMREPGGRAAESDGEDPRHDPSGKQVALVFLDLSTSMSRAGGKVAEGINNLAGELEPDTWLVLYGFNSRLRILHEGYASDLTPFSPDQFKLGSKSLLSGGTALFRAMTKAGHLLPYLERAAGAAVVWISDGENNRWPTQAQAITAVGLLKCSGIDTRLIGLMTSTASESALSRMLSILQIDAHDSVLEPQDAFDDATDFLAGSLYFERLPNRRNRRPETSDE